MSRINLLPDHFIARQRRTRTMLRFAIAGAFTIIYDPVGTVPTGS